MDDLTTRFWTDLIGRTTGPMTFRLVLQPLMAIYYAYRDGLHDARAGRPPYQQTMLNEPGERKALLLQGLKAVSRVIVLGVVMDVIYQLIVLERVYPGQVVVVVMLLAFVPYLLFRGPFARVAGRYTQT